VRLWVRVWRSDGLCARSLWLPLRTHCLQEQGGLLDRNLGR
jgi:hypothetical protein